MNLLLLHDVASLLGRKPFHITYALTQGYVPEPAIRLGNKRVFQTQDVERLATHFGITIEEDGSNGRPVSPIG